MTQRPKIIAANWKMHGTRASVTALLQSLLAMPVSVLRIIFPPFIFIPATEEFLQASPILWGGQNLAIAAEGAFTGEVSATMLKEFGCQYVLLGHSERRTLYGETDSMVAKKFELAQEAGLTPVLCVGETRAEREAGKTEAVILRQLESVLSLVGEQAFSTAIVAYEPVWAIGTGLTASPQQAQAIHELIRAYFCRFDDTIAARLPILYGGSVKPENAGPLFAQPDIDGALVGGASLQAAHFEAICAAAVDH